MTFAERREELFRVAGRPSVIPVVPEMPDIARTDVGAWRIWRSCSRKVRFGSEHDAERKAKQFGQKHYFCELCRGYHCTKRLARPVEVA